MIYIFEGPNGAGKSTLISAIKDELLAAGKPVRLIANKASNTAMKDYSGQLMQALEERQKGIYTLIDRFNFGEQVYPDLFGRPGQIDPHTDDVFVQIGVQLDAHWVVLVPPIYRMIEALEARGELPERGSVEWERGVDLLQRESNGFNHIANHHRRRWNRNVHINRMDLGLERSIDWFKFSTRFK